MLDKLNETAQVKINTPYGYIKYRNQGSVKTGDKI